MRYLQTVLLILFLGVLLIFAGQNMRSVNITFLAWSVEMPLALLAILIYALGMLSGWTVLGFLRRSIRTVSARQHDQD